MRRGRMAPCMKRRTRDATCPNFTFVMKVKTPGQSQINTNTCNRYFSTEDWMQLGCNCHWTTSLSRWTAGKIQYFPPLWPRSDLICFIGYSRNHISPEPLSFVALRSQIRFLSDVYNATSVWAAMSRFFRLSRQWNAMGLKILQRSRSNQVISHGPMKGTIDCTSMDWALCLKSALCPLTSGGRQKWLHKD